MKILWNMQFNLVIFFINKVTNRRIKLEAENSFKSANVFVKHMENDFQTRSRFDKFKMVTLEETKKLISKMVPKSCELGHIPTWVIKENINLFAPIIMDMINASLLKTEFPMSSESALVRPLLKKINLQLIDNNYRPVSNFSFVSKLTEKAACVQLWEAALQSGNVSKFQSAYREKHSHRNSTFDG